MRLELVPQFCQQNAYPRDRPIGCLTASVRNWQNRNCGHAFSLKSFASNYSATQSHTRFQRSHLQPRSLYQWIAGASLITSLHHVEMISLPNIRLTLLKRLSRLCVPLHKFSTLLTSVAHKSLLVPETKPACRGLLEL